MHPSALKRFLVLVVLLCAHTLYAVSPEELAAILRKAPDLKSFLANKPLQDEFYDALVQYYGKPIARSSFDAVIEKNRMLVEKVDGYAEKAWSPHTQTEFLVPFSIESAVETSGRTIDVKKFDDFARKLKTEHARKVKELIGIEVGEVKDHKFDEEIENKVRAEIGILTGEVAKIGRAHKAAVEGAATVALRKRAENARDIEIRQLLQGDRANGISHFLILRGLHSEATQDAFASRDADLTLDYLKNLREAPRSWLGPLQLEFPYPNVLISEIKQKMPEVANLLGKDELAKVRQTIGAENREKFPIPNDASEVHSRDMRAKRNANRDEHYRRFNDTAMFPIDYRVDETKGKIIEAGNAARDRTEFVPVPIRFIGEFDGIWLGECVATHCERFAVSAMDGVQKHHAFKDGKFKGFVMIAPVKTKDGTILGPVEFGVPELRQKAMARDPVSGVTYSTTGYDLWLDEALKRVPEGWRDFVSGSYNGIDNASVKGTVQASPSYTMRTPIAQSSEVTHLDPMAQQIPGLDKDPAYTYAGRMIAEGTIGGQKALTPLRPFGPDEVAEMLKDPKNDATIIKALQQPRFATDPRSGEWMDILVARSVEVPGEDMDVVKRENARSIARLFKSDLWAFHPGAARWITDLIEKTAYEKSEWSYGSKGRVPKDPAQVLVQEVFTAPHWVENDNSTRWVDALMQTGRAESVFEYLLNRPAWIQHPDALVWTIKGLVGDYGRMRDLKPEHLDALRARLGDAENIPWDRIKDDEWDKMIEIIFETNRAGRMGSRYYESVVTVMKEFLEVGMPHSEKAAHALMSLAFDNNHFYQQRAMELVLANSERSDRIEVGLGFSAEYLVRTVAARGKDAREQLNEQWMQLARMAQGEEVEDRFESGSWVNTAGLDPHAYANTIRVLDYVENHWEGHENAMSVAIGLMAAFRRNAVNTEISTPSEGTAGMFAMSLGRIPESPQKFEIARRSLKILTDMALEEPVMLHFAKQAFDHAKKIQFLDNGRSQELLSKLSATYPEFWHTPNGFEGETFLKLVQARNKIRLEQNSAEKQRLAEQLVHNFSHPHAFLNAEEPFVRQVALIDQLIAQAAAGHASADPSDPVSRRLRIYRERHPEEYDGYCAAVMKAMGEAKAAEE